MADPQLIPVFIPPLVVVLADAERRKGRPLTEREVRHAGLSRPGPGPDLGAVAGGEARTRGIVRRIALLENAQSPVAHRLAAR
jgi:hypothetical protein